MQINCLKMYELCTQKQMNEENHFKDPYQGGVGKRAKLGELKSKIGT